MPIIIHADKDVNADVHQPEFQQNNGIVLTTKKILKSVKQVNSRPEMIEFIMSIGNPNYHFTERAGGSFN